MRLNQKEKNCSTLNFQLHEYQTPVHKKEKYEVLVLILNQSKIGGKNVKAFKTKRGKSTTEMEGIRL